MNTLNTYQLVGELYFSQYYTWEGVAGYSDVPRYRIGDEYWGEIPGLETTTSFADGRRDQTTKRNFFDLATFVADLPAGTVITCKHYHGCHYDGATVYTLSDDSWTWSVDELEADD